MIVGLGHLLRTFGVLLVLGLVMGFSPTSYGIEIGAVEREPRSRRRVLLIAGAVATAATLLALVFVVVSPDTLHALWTGRVRVILSQRWFDAGVGLALIGAAAVQWRRAARPRRVRTSRLDRPRVLFLVVLVDSLLSTTGPATMYLVVRSIGTTAPELWVPGYLVFLVGLAAPYVVLAVALTQIPAFGHAMSRVLTAIGRKDLRRPVAGVIALVGAGLVVWSVVALVRAG